MIHLLDTSALLAHHFSENGWEVVQELIEGSSELGVSVLTLYEFERRLVDFSVDQNERLRVAAGYRECLDAIYSVDEAVCAAALELRKAAPVRIVAMDMLIAATAKVHGATLVHRDAHFSEISEEHLPQLILPEK